MLENISFGIIVKQLVWGNTLYRSCCISLCFENKKIKKQKRRRRKKLKFKKKKKESCV